MFRGITHFSVFTTRHNPDVLSFQNSNQRKEKTFMPDRFRPRPEELQPLQIGPLAPYLESFGVSLSRQGYCHTSGWDKLQLVADLSRWMDRRQLAPKQLD